MYINAVIPCVVSLKGVLINEESNSKSTHMGGIHLHRPVKIRSN